eukprot:scaffold61802_cov20-Tisochrysis_lutea.AAC.1
MSSSQGGTYAGGGVWVGSRGGEGVCLVPANPEDAAKVDDNDGDDDDDEENTHYLHLLKFYSHIQIT